jgi:glycosyltransferase involved in cell wall biosynthesis
MKRIAYLLHRFPGITDTFIKREIRSLQQAGTEVQVISVWKPGQLETTPTILSEWSSETHFILPKSGLGIAAVVLVSAIRSPRRFLFSLRLALSTARPGFHGTTYQLFYFIEAVLAAEILRRNAIDHIHNHIGDQSGTVTMLAARLAGVDYSITFHGWPVFFDAKYSRIKEKVLGARFTRAISYFCRSQLMMFSGCTDPAPIKVIHCGLDMKKYCYRPPKMRIKKIFCVARLAPEKGHSFLLGALKLLLDQGHELELRLAGDGPSQQALSTLARDLGISSQVHFLGFLSEEEIISELHASDLCVLPSFVEGIPVCLMEAMAIGVPVIATNIAGTSELVKDGISGLLVRPSDSQALADAIVKMIDDYEFRLRATELGRKHVVRDFDIDKETAKLNQYLTESCSREL